MSGIPSGSTQHKFGSCIDEFAPRPDLVPTFTGKVIEHTKGLCLNNSSKLKPHYGSGAPIMQTSVVDVFGLLSLLEAPTYTDAMTSEGVIRLPKEQPKLQYMPSVSTLDFLTHTQGSRLNPLPHRYYSR